LLTFASATPYSLTCISTFDIAPSHCDQAIGIEKTCDYLTWRYMRKPFNDYQIYRLAHDGAFAGYVVLREAARRAYLYDIIADMTNIRVILAAIHNLLIQHNKRIAILYVLANTFWREALRHYVLVPRRLGRQHYYLTVKPHSARLRDDQTILGPEQWRLMAGDIL
jgi:hypothetical protein